VYPTLSPVLALKTTYSNLRTKEVLQMEVPWVEELKNGFLFESDQNVS
jgi:hypothetical protein